MPKLKLSTIPDSRPVRLAVELPAVVHRDLADYAEILGRETGQKLDPAKIVAPMLARFMATDREFTRLRRTKGEQGQLPHSAGPRTRAAS